MAFPSRGDQPVMPTLRGSIWAWDGNHLKVIRVYHHQKLTVDMDISTASTSRRRGPNNSRT